jgi:hypothetical protein
MHTHWFDRAFCGLFAILVFATLGLPDLCVICAPDGSTLVLVGIIVDPPTGAPETMEMYSSAPMTLPFLIGAVYYWVRATRANHALEPTRRTFRFVEPARTLHAARDLRCQIDDLHIPIIW